MTDELQLSGELNWNNFRQIHLALVESIEAEGCTSIELNFSAVTKVYPNGAVPLIVLLDYYRKSRGVQFSSLKTEHLAVLQTHDYLAEMHPDHTHVRRGGRSALHAFQNDQELNVLINQKIDEILSLANYAPGVLTAFEWFVNEIAGNVLVHSNTSKGWLQVVVHPSTKHLAVVVADGGIGIPSSIRGSRELQERYGSNIDDSAAIEISLRDGVTSKPDFGQGKGLTGTMAIVKANRGGKLAVTSQRGRVVYQPDGIGMKVQSHIPPFHGTLVDVQLDFAQPLEIEKALWGHLPVNFTETVYGKELPEGLMRLAMKLEAPSFGNRITAARIRKKIENLLTEAPADALEIDFEGVSMMASSFADEVFGKLAAHLGIIGFSRRLKFKNLNAFCQGIIDDVVQARMAQTYMNKK
jgi:anti-anti-sigma regulatory factor